MDRFDVEKQEIHRESEGQDTITSLTNNQFLKTLEKLKRQESVRSTASQVSAVGSLSSSMRSLKKTPSSDTASITSVKSSTGSLKIPKSLVSLFKSHEDKMGSLYYESLLNELSDQQQSSDRPVSVGVGVESSPRPTYKSQISSTSVSSTNSNYSTLKKSFNGANKLSESQKSSNLRLAKDEDESKKVKLLQSASVISHQNNNTKTDEVFDALSVILKHQNEPQAGDNEFYDQLKLFITQRKLNHEKKLDKVKWMCSLAVYAFFFVMFLMVCYFVKTLYSIVGHINDNLLINYRNSFYRDSAVAATASSTEELIANTTQILDFFSSTAPETF